MFDEVFQELLVRLRLLILLPATGDVWELEITKAISITSPYT
jgi:hypothetical protein